MKQIKKNDEDKKKYIHATAYWFQGQWADKDCHWSEACGQVISAEDTVQGISAEGGYQERPYPDYRLGGQKAKGLHWPWLPAGLGWCSDEGW